MAERPKKPSETPTTSDNSDLGDSPLVPLRSFIPTYNDHMEGFQIEDRTLLDPRSSVESDANLSYPSHELSLLEQLRSGLSQGRLDVHKILNLKKSRRDMTIDFSLASSPGSQNSTADLTLPPERRQTKILTRKKKNNMTVNFTMNDTASSCDNQENESPVLPSNRQKPLFKRPFAKKMSMRIDDVSDSDGSKGSICDDSLPTLDPKRRPIPLKSSMRSRGSRDKKLVMDLSLDGSENGEKSIDQASFNDGEHSSSVPNEVPNHDESLPKLDPTSHHVPLKLSRLRTQDKNMTFDISLDSSEGNEKSLDQGSLIDAEVPLSESEENENDNSLPKVSLLPDNEETPMKFPHNDPVQVNDQTLTPDDRGNGNKNPVLDSSAGLVLNPSSNGPGCINDQTFVHGGNSEGICDHEVTLKNSTGSVADAAVPINDNTFVVEAVSPQELVNPPARQGSPQSNETPTVVDIDEIVGDKPALRASIPTTLTQGNALSRKKSVGLGSEESTADDTLLTTGKNDTICIDAGTNDVAQLFSTSHAEKNLNRSTSSKLAKEPANFQHSNKLKGRKNSFSVNFTLSETNSTDSHITSPNILESRKGPFLRKKGNKISIPIQFGEEIDDTLPNTSHGDGQESTANVNGSGNNSSELLAPASSSRHGTNNSDISSPVISGKHTNPLKKRLRGNNKISIPYRCDDTVLGDGSPNTSATDNQKHVSNNRLSSPENTDGITSGLLEAVDEGASNDSGSSCPLTKSLDEAEDNDKTSDLLPSSKCMNPLANDRLERNKFSIPASKLEDSVIDCELSSTGIGDAGAGSSENKSSAENRSSSNGNPEYSAKEVGNSEIALPDNTPNVTQSSDAVSLGCSLDDIPRSSNDYSSGSLKSYRKISVQPQETSNVSRGMSPSMERHSGVALSPDYDLSSDGLHLELSPNESLQYSGMDSSASSIKAGDTEAKEKNSSSVDNAEAAQDRNHPASTVTQDSPVLKTKNPPLLRRSKRGSKNVTVDVNSSDSKISVIDVSGLARKPYSNPLKTKSRLNKMSIAFTNETNDSSSVSETDTEAFCGHLTNAKKASTPKTTHSMSTIHVQTIQEVGSRETANNGDTSGTSSKTADMVNEAGFEAARELNNFTPDSLAPIPKRRSTRQSNRSLLNNVGSEIASDPLISSQETKSPASVTLTSDEMNSGVQRKPSPVGPSPILDDQPHILDASHSLTTVELVQPIDVSPVVGPILNEPTIVDDNVVSFLPEKHGSHHVINEDEGGGGESSYPPSTQTMKTSASSLRLHLTTLNSEAGDATNVKSHYTVPHLSPTHKAAAIPMKQPVPSDFSIAETVNLHKGPYRTSISSSNKSDPITGSSKANGQNVASSNVSHKPTLDAMTTAAVGEGQIDASCQPHLENTSHNANQLSDQDVTLASVLQQTVHKNILYSGKPVPHEADGKGADENYMDASISRTAPKTALETVERTSPVSANKNEPPPCSFIPAGTSGILVKDDQPEPEVPRLSKRKSVSFKPSNENLYHSPPDHGSVQYQDQNGDGKVQADDGYEFSRIQMTTDISEIQPSPRTKRPKRHFSSTPISKPKKSTSPSKPDDEIFAQPQPLATSAKPTKHQFVVPPGLPNTKRVSIQLVPEIITPHQGEPRPVAEDGPGSSEGGSSYDLSCENSLEISAIPKDVTAPKWGNVYHSTPLHRTKASMKRTKKKTEPLPAVPQCQEEPEEEAEARVVNHSVQTSNNQGSRSKTSLESGSASDPLPESSNVSLRRSARRNRRPVPTAPQTPKTDGGDKPVDDSPSNRIAIQDNTILSTHVESQSRTRGSRTRSTTGSTLKSYDSHRKMTSRRLFNNGDENKSSTDAGYPTEETETSSPKSTEVPPTSIDAPPASNDVTSMSQQDEDILLSPAETSIPRSYQPSIPLTDENTSIISGQPPEDYSDNESIISGVSTGSTSSVPSHVVTRQSFESQLSSLRYRSERRSREEAGSHRRAEPPKLRSKYAIPRPNKASDLDLIYPTDVPIKKRKRTQSTSAKLFNPGAKWKKSKYLYAWLKKKLEPEYKLRTNLESERLVIELDRARILVSQGHTKNALDLSIERLKRLKICNNQLQLWGFFMKFMPFDFVREVVPMGGAFGKPFNSEYSFMPDDSI